MAFAAIMVYLRVLYCTLVEPEVVSLTQVCQTKQAWSRKMTQDCGNKVVICGGSSCAYSIMGMRLLQQHGMPTVNMGLHAGYGPSLLIQAGLWETRPGDTLIVGVEPLALTKPHEMLPCACKLGYALGHPEWAYLPWETPMVPYLGTAMRCNMGWKSILLLPDVCHLGKTVPPDALDQMDASGWMSTSYRPKKYDSGGHYGSHLSADSRKLLRHVSLQCQQKGVRVAYSLAWSLREPASAAAFQSANLSLLKEIAAIMPVLKDPRLGVCTDPSLFSNTYFHLNAEAAAVRSDELARQIKDWDVWSPGELEAWENRQPRSE